MDYRIGLDVGTASCGLVAWTLDADGQPARHAYDSLDIWSEPLLPAKSGGVGEPKKAARRAARMMRRGICRRARRLRRIAHLASLLGLQSTAIAPDAGQHIHHLRAAAAEQRIDLDDLLRVLMRLAKNRGPSGDWVYAEPDAGNKAKSKPRKAEASTEADVDKPAETSAAAQEDRRTIAGGVRKLESLASEAAVASGKSELTLGQYLAWRFERGEGALIGKPHIGLYPSRRMVEYEFDRIWDTQAKFHPVLRDKSVRKQFFDTIFHQRPLKSPAPMVGRCPLEPTLPRAPAAQMTAQAFRIEKQLADLRWGIGKRAEPLSQEQKAVVRRLLNEQGEAKLGSVRTALQRSGCLGPAGRGLNMERSSRDSLKGNTTLATFRKLGLDAEWAAIGEMTQIRVVNFMADLGSPDALDSEDWYRNFSTAAGTRREFSSALVDFVNLMRKHPKFDRLSAMGFDGGRMAYSIKAMEKLTVLMAEGWDERGATDQAYPDHNKPRQLRDELPLPPSTGNTVVDVALRQVYRAVRRAMAALGEPPTQVIVELSRDMGLGAGKRGEIENKIKRNAKARQAIVKALEEHGVQATERKIVRYQLWESQLHYCPYCDRRIELGEALDRGETEREHILPRTLTRVGGKRSQIVLAHKSCNQEKGNRTPWQAFGSDEVRWRIIEERAAQLERNRQRGKARLLLLKDWEHEVLDDETISGFTDRQFHESSWIAKLTALWLRSVCADVSVSRGELTAHLRRIWKLDTVIPEVRYANALPVLDRDGKSISKQEFEQHRSWWEGHNESAGGVPTDRKPDKRIDHRHHLVDALVISVCDRRLFKRMADHYRVESDKAARGERARLRLYVEPPTALRDLAVEVVSNTEIRHKPDRYPDGPLFEQTAYGVSRKVVGDGKRLLAVMKPLTALIDVKGSVEKTRRALETIESDVTRDTVLRAFDQRTTSGVPLKQVFAEPILHPQFNTPIRRVRTIGNSTDTSVEVTHSNRQGTSLRKRYVSAGNARLEVRTEGGKLNGKPRLLSVQQAMRERSKCLPANVTPFWKGDTVELPDGTRHIVGIIAAQGGGQLRLVPVTETCAFGELKKRGLTMKTVSGNALAKVKLVDV